MPQDVEQISKIPENDTSKQDLSKSEKIKIQEQMIILAVKETFIGFFIISVILYIHAKLTLTNFFGIILDTGVALRASLILSVILTLLAVGFAGYLIYRKKYYFVLGMFLAVPIMFTFSSSVREGFAIFFAFI